MRRAPISTTAAGPTSRSRTTGRSSCLSRRRDADVPADRADQAAAHGLKAIGRAHPENSIGWYRRRLDLGAADRGRRHWLEFDGVFRDCLVFVNGYVVGRNESGYAPFRVDITDFLDYDGGPNQLASASTRRWAKAGSTKAPASTARSLWSAPIPSTFRNGGPSCAPSRSTAAARGCGSRPKSLNSGDTPAEVVLRQHIRRAGRSHGRDPARGPARTGAGRACARATTEVAIPAPLLWSIETPSLYTWSASSSATAASSTATRPASASAPSASTPQRGFFLNGQPVKLLGVCNHQDHAGVGTGIPRRLNEWRVEQMQEMGVNAWRSAHNPPVRGPARHLRREGHADDRRGAAQQQRPGGDEPARPDPPARPQPSVRSSSGRSATRSRTRARARGARIATEMAQQVRRLDPTRPITFALDNSWDTGIGRVVDVIGFNYRIDQIEASTAASPTSRSSAPRPAARVADPRRI